MNKEGKKYPQQQKDINRIQSKLLNIDKRHDSLCLKT